MFGCSDATIAQYADYDFDYDEDSKVTNERTEGGSREYSFAYTVNPNYDPAAPRDFNFWVRKTTETFPDGTKNIVYCNAIGFTMLKIVDSGTDRWYEFNHFDDVGRRIRSAASSAINGYDEALNDLLGYNLTTDHFQYLRDNEGLIEQTEYYGSTDVAPGYIKARNIRQGQTNPPVKVAEWEYGSHTAANGVTVHPVTKKISFRNEDGTGPIETSYSYTWHTLGGLATNQVLQRTTTLPVVPTGQILRSVPRSGTALVLAEADSQ